MCIIKNLFLSLVYLFLFGCSLSKRKEDFLNKFKSEDINLFKSITLVNRGVDSLQRPKIIYILFNISPTERVVLPNKEYKETSNFISSDSVQLIKETLSKCCKGEYKTIDEKIDKLLLRFRELDIYSIESNPNLGNTLEFKISKNESVIYIPSNTTISTFYQSKIKSKINDTLYYYTTE